jgi:hypothetical protein
MDSEIQFGCWLDGALTRYTYFSEQLHAEEVAARARFSADQVLQIRVLKALCCYRRIPRIHPRHKTDVGEYEFGALLAFAAIFGRSGSMLHALHSIKEFVSSDEITLTNQDKMILKVIENEQANQRSLINLVDAAFFDEIVLKWYDGEDVLVAKLSRHLDRIMLID